MIEIKSRWSGKVLYTAEDAQDVRRALQDAVACGANLCGANLCGANLCGANLRDADLRGANLRDADLRGANLRDADLCGANLRGANLCDADLCGANLRGANLRGANLRGANLCDANLRDANLWRQPLWPMRQDFFSILDQAPAEVATLREKIVAGEIEGSTYEGPCSCLAGTIAVAHGCAVGALEDELGIETNASRPAEQWFITISQGDKPLDVTDESIVWKEQSEGVFRISWALAWLDEWVESRTAVAKALAGTAS
jgi:Pentapeptide repeats (8 copies)